MPASLLQLELGPLTTWPWSPCPKGCVLLCILGWVSRCWVDPSLQAGMQGLSGREGMLGSRTALRQWKKAVKNNYLWEVSTKVWG